MDVGKTTLFSALQTQMQYLGAEQSALAGNVANANTPKYKAKTVERPSFSEVMNGSSSLSPVRTSPAHMTLSGDAGRFKVVQDRNIQETKPDGNNVSVEEQMLRISQNRLEYDEAIQIYRKMANMLRLATQRQQ